MLKKKQDGKRKVTEGKDDFITVLFGKMKNDRPTAQFLQSVTTESPVASLYVPRGQSVQVSSANGCLAELSQRWR